MNNNANIVQKAIDVAKKDKQRITAVTISNMLEARARSNNHVYFTEVTDYGRHTDGKQARIDAIAMKISYSKMQLWGYEIKVSRHDFVADEKWHQYLEMCNSLYFVCPYGLIAKDEVPKEAGLMYITKTGGRLRTVKKAPYRTVEYRPEYFMGMIFNKCGVMHEQDDREYRLQRAIKSASQEEDCVQLGMQLGSELACKLREQRQEQEALEREIERLKEVAVYLEEQGIVVNGAKRQYGEGAVQRLERMRKKALEASGLEQLLRNVRSTQQSITCFGDRLEQEHEAITSPFEQGTLF